MRSRRPSPSLLIPVLLLVLGVLAGCGEDDGADVREVGAAESSGSASATASGTASGSVAEEATCAPVGDPAEADANVVVRLTEWGIEPSPAEVPAGTVTFVVRNEGEEVHELVVIEADGTEGFEVEDGQVQEDALPEGALIGEVEGFPAASTCDGTYELEPGNYVLLCNIVETESDGTLESHYEEGMRTEFTVT